jgi:hypothetical protein
MRQGSRAFLLVAAAAFAPVACGPVAGGPDDTRCNPDWARDLAPGELAYGLEPKSLLAQFSGTFTGDLRWRTGETTTVTVSAPWDDSLPITAYMICDRLGQVFVELRADISTVDRSLVASGRLIVRTRFPNGGPPVSDPPELDSLIVTLGPPASGLVAALPYQSPDYSLELSWNMATHAPFSAMFLLLGTASGSTQRDSVNLATLTF